MKKIIPAFQKVLFSLFVLLAPTAWAQPAAATAASSQPGHVVVLYLNALNNSFNPSFDTGGELVGGLSSTELSAKFTRASAATIINFIVDKGYRVVAFTANQAEIFNGFGGKLEGYTVILEQVR